MMRLTARWFLACSLSALYWYSSAAIAQEDAAQGADRSGTWSVELLSQPSHRFVLSGSRLPSPKEAAEHFYVTVDSSELDQPPRLLGKYQAQDDRLEFLPRFPLSPSVRYRVYLKSESAGALPDPSSLYFELPRQKQQPTAKVARIYPSADELPENLLKFYIHFSEPMSRGQAYEHIQLLQDNEPVDHPFLELGEELWDAEQTRFTLFIHPGRIKRGLRPREEEGPALASGGTYTLRIDKRWSAADGLSLVETHEKNFSVTEADHEQPDLESWRIETPSKDTLQPVSLILNEPLDHAMLSRVLAVKHQSGKVINGQVEVLDHESKWQFTPQDAWPVGTYNIEVAANLEDLCGNSIARPFEVKMQEGTAASPATKVAIEFIVK